MNVTKVTKVLVTFSLSDILVTFLVTVVTFSKVVYAGGVLRSGVWSWSLRVLSGEAGANVALTSLLSFYRMPSD